MLNFIMGYSKLILIIFASTILGKHVNADTSMNCGDWEAYKDEKCFKIYSTNEDKAYADAVNACKQLDSGASLVSVHSLEEQNFLVNYLNKTVLNDVWLSGQYNDHQLKWTDGTNATFTNWAEGNPKNLTDFKCVQLSLEHTLLGRWLNEKCEKENLVVCQKDQNWLVKVVKELQDALQNLESKVKDATVPAGTVAYFASSTVPRGWLKANGSAVSRSTYATLYNAIGVTHGEGDGITTFNLPELRGEFIRGWSDGRDGVDIARTFGGFQYGSSIPLAEYINGSAHRAIADGFQNRWGFIAPAFDDGFETHVPAGAYRNGVTFPSVGTYNDIVSYVETNGDTFQNGGSAYVTHWSLMRGTRPRNIALLACIKF